MTSAKQSPIRRSFESIDLSTANIIRHFDEGWNSPEANLLKAAEKKCDVKTTINNKLVKKYNDRKTADNYKKLEPKTAKTDLLGTSSQSIVLKDKVELEKLKKKRNSLFCKCLVDWEVTNRQVIRISSHPEQDTKTNESSFIVLLDSKFYAPNSKTRTTSITSFYSDFDTSSFEGPSVASSNDDGSSVEFLVRNIDICNAAEDLIKDVIVSESRVNSYWGPDIEWITISSFINQLTAHRSKNSFSDLSNEEVELTNTTLQATKSSIKENSNNSFIKHLLNDTILEKLKETHNKRLNTYNNQGCQYTFNEVIKVLDTGNILSENKDALSSSSSSAPPIKRNESHSRCCKYFMQSMMNQASDTFKKFNLFDPFRKFAKTASKKPGNWFKYTNGTSTSTTSTSTSSK